MADEDLRHAYARGAPADHPDDALWERLATGEAGAVERGAVRAHVLRCAACARVWRSLAALASEARGFDRQAPVAAFAAALPAATWAKGRSWLGALTSLAAAGLAAWIAFRPAPPPIVPVEEPLRSGSTEDRPIALSPRGFVHDVSDGFRWRRVSGARSYCVRLLGPTGDRIWTSPALPSDFTPWPAELDPKPGRYVWTVVVLGGPSGAGEVASPPAAFEIRP